MKDINRIYQEIIDNTYPNSKYIATYKKFNLEIIDKEYKSLNGDYNWLYRTIRIFNLYRNESDIIASSIHDLAHHIDFCNRGKTDHSYEFYRTLEDLIFTSLNLGILTKEDYLSAYKNTSELTQINGIVLRHKLETKTFKKGKIQIQILGGYEVKYILKSNGYKWSKDERIWKKNIFEYSLKNEKNFLDEYALSYSIKYPDKIYSSKNKTIVAGKGSFEFKDQLKADGFMFNAVDKLWNKKGSLEELEDLKTKYPSVIWSTQ